MSRTIEGVIHRFAAANVAAVGDDEVDVIVCTSTADALDGDVWLISGMDLSRFEAHPVVLWNHDMSQPIGRASNLKATASRLTARVTFPPAGESPKADEIRALVKSGFVTGVSAGIIARKAEPIDPRRPYGGQLISESELIEFSIVSVPADTTAGVTARNGNRRTIATERVPVQRLAVLKAVRAPIYGEGKHHA